MARPRFAICCGCRPASPFKEVYDGNDDLARFQQAPHDARTRSTALRAFDAREVEQGTRFHYASNRDRRPGAVAARRDRHDAQRISDATAVAADGRGSRRDLDQDQGRHSKSRREVSMPSCATMAGSACCWPMTARPADNRSCRRIICLMRPTGIAIPRRSRRSKATPYFGYGYQFWLFPGEKRRFALLGVYGQSIFVDPEREARDGDYGRGEERQRRQGIAGARARCPLARIRRSLWHLVNSEPAAPICSSISSWRRPAECTFASPGRRSPSSWCRKLP